MGFFSRLKKKVTEKVKQVGGIVKKAATFVGTGGRSVQKTKGPTIKETVKKVTTTVKKGISTFREKEKELRETETKRREEVGETKLDVVKKVAFPEKDPMKEIVMAVVPVGKGIKGIGFGIKTGDSAITAATNYWAGISKTAQNTGKLPKPGPTIGISAENSKTVKQVTGIVSKFFGPKALTFYGGWVASVGMGIWANAEAPEGIMFPVTKFLIPEAERTGDWTAVDEAIALADEVTDLSTWEKIIAMSPAGLIPGALNKLEGNIAGKEILKKYAEDQKVKQELGQTEADYWKQRRIEEVEQDKAIIDYYNDERKKMVTWELDAEAEARRIATEEYEEGREKQRAEDIKARNEDAAFWAKERKKQRELEAEDRIAVADFWLAYKKQALKIADDSRPSKLNFGLI